jgi:hypothetical protein
MIEVLAPDIYIYRAHWSASGCIATERVNLHIIYLFQFQGFGMFDSIPRTFNRQYRCYSVMLCPGNEREDVEKGGKSR